MKIFSLINTFIYMNANFSHVCNCERLPGETQLKIFKLLCSFSNSTFKVTYEDKTKKKKTDFFFFQKNTSFGNRSSF